MDRLQKVLAQAGVASRRKCEEIILAGRVEVNGTKVTTLGVKVDARADVVKVDGRAINREKTIVVMLNKPKGVISSVHDPKGRKVVTDYVKAIPERVYPVGRLDYDTEGLLLLTNDGEFANRLMHPKHHVPRTYHAVVKGVPHGTILDKLKSGVLLEDGMTSPALVDYVDIDPEKKVSTIAITLFEGKNRQVRRMFEAVSYPVITLKRVQFGTLFLAGLARGQFRHLTAAEIKSLADAASATHNVQN